jgi:N6-adenosine-specific RNA methylase IME4
MAQTQKAHGTVNGNLFDSRPVEIGGFILAGGGATLQRRAKPTEADWQLAFDYATSSEESSPYWVGDLLAYAETREDWKQRFDQLISRTKLAPGTLHNRTSICRSVSVEVREMAPTPTHAAAVAALPAEDQKRVMRRVQEEGLNVSQTRKVVKRMTRPRIIEGQAALKGKYRVIYADPPWKYDNNRAMPDGSLTPAEDSYEGMTIAEICALPVPLHTEHDAVLFMWVTNSHLLQNPGAREVIEAWGFKYRTNYVWNKVNGRPGHYSYPHHELLLVCVKGNCTPDVPILLHDHASVFTEKRHGEHSSKPAFARKLIEGLYPDGTRLELFGRKKVLGWTVFGNDARLWEGEQ